MKRFALFVTAAFVLLTPTLVRAQAPYVYRPELRAWVYVPKAAPTVVAQHNPAEHIARHEAMAKGLRGTRMAQGAVHCDRMIKEAREELRRQF